MSQQQSVLFGAGGIIVGLLAGIAFSSGGPDEADIGNALTNALTPGQEAARETAGAQQEAIAALGERMAALETAMPDTEAVADAVTERVGTTLDEKMSGLQDSLSGAIGDAAAEQKTALETAVSSISTGLEQSAQTAAAAVASASTGEATEAEGVAVSEPLKVGRTALFADGKVRAFVSRIDPSGGAVRLVVNQEQVRLGSGGSAPVSFEDKNCSIVVLGLSDEGATLGSDCDAAQPQGEMAQAGGDSAGGVPPAPEDGFRPGTMANLGEGALRVFVSGVAQDGSAARIAVNGFSTQVVPAGDSIDVTANDRSCTVTVTGVGNGMVGLEGSCG